MTRPRYIPEITLGHILQAVVIIGTVAVFAFRLEARVSVAESRLDTIERVYQATLDRVDKALIRIDDKLDRHMEKKP